MAVFYDTGGGDIYGGETKEKVIAAMKADAGDDLDLEDMFEVEGSTKMRIEDPDGSGDMSSSTLEKEYDETMGAYCVASENC